jgi:hypothetical protein
VERKRGVKSSIAIAILLKATTTEHTVGEHPFGVPGE